MVPGDTNAVGARPVRVVDAEASLLGEPATDTAFDTAGVIVRNSLEPAADLHATANYRRHVAAVLTRRGLDAAASSIGVPA